MTDEAALLAAILAEPAEDTPRLVYADWLDENGQHERAEFIRVQVELARLDAAIREPNWHWREGELVKERDALRRRERELLGSREGWRLFPTEVPIGDRVIVGSVPVWRRGFVAEVCLTWEEWLAHAAAILKQQPIERVRLTTWEVPDDIADFVHGRGWRVDALAALAGRWPGIEFELPSESR